MEVTPDRVVVLADSAERAEEIDVAEAEAARGRAESSIANRQETADLALATSSLRQANLRLKIGRRRGGSRPPTMGGGSSE
jgi:F-type H+-transporting ATPase subunit epsilon